MVPLALLASFWLFFAQTTPLVAPPQTPRPPHQREEYAGVDACRPCHAAIVRTFVETPHWLSSRAPSREAIAGPIPPGGQDIVTSNPELRYRVTATQDGFFETALIGRSDPPQIRSERIDIVIGSGRKGQTYLWWRGDELFQLPLSYWGELKAWANSPGQSDRTADFTRPVIPRCVDCHATFVQAAAATSNRYDPRSLLLGVSCEKCHGPALAHVAAHQNRGRDANIEADVVNPARLGREGKFAVCASCHGGQIVGPPFSYVPGDAVKLPAVVPRMRTSGGPTTGPINLGIDSHGQQATALMNSRCYQASAMTCETCHNPHIRQPEAAAFSSKCMTCHTIEACGRFPRDGRAIAGKCVDCHMPLQRSGLIVSANAAGTAQAHLRTHLIAIYPDGR